MKCKEDYGVQSIVCLLLRRHRRGARAAPRRPAAARPHAHARRAPPPDAPPRPTLTPGAHATRRSHPADAAPTPTRCARRADDARGQQKFFSAEAQSCCRSISSCCCYYQHLLSHGTEPTRSPPARQLPTAATRAPETVPPTKKTESLRPPP